MACIVSNGKPCDSKHSKCARKRAAAHARIGDEKSIQAHLSKAMSK